MSPKADLELALLLPQSPESWDHRSVSPYLPQVRFKKKQQQKSKFLSHCVLWGRKDSATSTPADLMTGRYLLRLLICVAGGLDCRIPKAIFSSEWRFLEAPITPLYNHDILKHGINVDGKQKRLLTKESIALDFCLLILFSVQTSHRWLQRPIGPFHAEPQSGA